MFIQLVFRLKKQKTKKHNHCLSLIALILQVIHWYMISVLAVLDGWCKPSYPFLYLSKYSGY